MVRCSLPCLVAALIMFLHCAPSLRRIERNTPAGKDFFLLIEQENIGLSEGNGQTVALKRMPFDMVFVSDSLRRYMVNFSLQRDALTQLLSGNDPEKIPGLCGGCGMAEGSNDPPREAVISSEGSNYWFHESPSSTRFHHVAFINNRYILTRSIAAFGFQEEKGPVRIEQVNFDSLFVCILTYRKDSTSGDFLPDQRLGFTLVFGNRQAVTGSVVTIPVPLPLPIRNSTEAIPPATKEKDPREYIVRLDAETKPVGDCFELIGRKPPRDTLYKMKICSENFIETKTGVFEGTFTNLLDGCRYSLQCTGSDGETQTFFQDVARDDFDKVNNEPSPQK
jgi:hypothetical protein